MEQAGKKESPSKRKESRRESRRDCRKESTKSFVGASKLKASVAAKEASVDRQVADSDSPSRRTSMPGATDAPKVLFAEMLRDPPILTSEAEAYLKKQE